MSVIQVIYRAHTGISRFKRAVSMKTKQGVLGGGKRGVGGDGR